MHCSSPRRWRTAVTQFVARHTRAAATPSPAAQCPSTRYKPQVSARPPRLTRRFSAAMRQPRLRVGGSAGDVTARQRRPQAPQLGQLAAAYVIADHTHTHTHGAFIWSQQATDRSSPLQPDREGYSAPVARPLTKR